MLFAHRGRSVGHAATARERCQLSTAWPWGKTVGYEPAAVAAAAASEGSGMKWLQRKFEKAPPKLGAT